MSQRADYSSDHRKLLIAELSQRKARNPSFSLRSFARFLSISPAHLSLLISGKKPLTRKQALKISEKLNLSPGQRQELLQSAYPDLKFESAIPVRQKLLGEDEFSLIADWHHLAILSLGSIKGNRANSKWIAKKLGLPEITALDAFQRLQRLHLIKIEDGGFSQAVDPLQTTRDVPSAAIRRHHKQNLELAKEKIETASVAEREYSSITLAGNPKNIPKIKKIINEFKFKVAQELEHGEKKEVYTFSIQLFPVTIQEVKK